MVHFWKLAAAEEMSWLAGLVRRPTCLTCVTGEIDLRTQMLAGAGPRWRISNQNWPAVRRRCHAIFPAHEISKRSRTWRLNRTGGGRAGQQGGALPRSPNWLEDTKGINTHVLSQAPITLVGGRLRGFVTLHEQVSQMLEGHQRAKR